MNTRNEHPPDGSPGQRWRSDALRLAGIGLAYITAHKLAYFFPGAGGVIAAIWPASGVALAALLLHPLRLWSAVLGVCAGANLAVELVSGRSLGVELGFILANVIESGASAWFITRWSRRVVSFNRVSEILALIFAAVVVNGVSALLGGATASLDSGQPFWTFYLTWWIGDGLGILLVTPLIVAWFRPPELSAPKVNWVRVFEGAAVLALAFLLSWAYFGVERDRFAIPPHSYMLFVPLVWAALRMGVRGTTTALALLAVVEIAGTASGLGGYPLGGADSTQRIQWLQLFLAVKCVTALLLAASFAERKAAEQSLRDSEASLRALGDNLPDGMVYQVVRELDGRMRFVYLSASVQRLHGLSAEAVMRDPTLLYHQANEADRIAIAADEAESLKNLSVFKAIVQMRRADGMMRWMRISSQPRRLPDGRVLWDGIETDVTEQKEAEEKLRHVNRALRTISNCNQVLVRAQTEEELLGQICTLIVEDGGYRLVWVGFAEHNESKTIRLAAYAGGEAGTLEKQTFTWADLPSGGAGAGAAIRTGQAIVCSDLLNDPGASPDREEAIRRGVRSSIALPLRSEGSVFGALSIYSTTAGTFDEAEVKLLTELADDLAFGIQALRRRQIRAEAEARVRNLLLEAEQAHAKLLDLLKHHEEAEDALRVSEERLRSAMEHSPIGMALAATDGRWLEVNPALCRIVGYSPAELQTTDYQRITHPEDLELDREQLRQMLAHEIESYQLEKRYLHKDGRVVWIQLNVSLVWNADGTPRHFVTQVQDISSRKQADAERGRLVCDLGERVKELTALHRAARLLQQERPFDQRLLAELVALLPPAWQFPDICEARVIYGALEAKTARWTETPWRQKVAFTTSGGHLGTIEVVYRESRPPAGEGPFLVEERRLLESLADLLAAYLERKHAERALLDSRAKLVLAMEMARLAHWEYDVAAERLELDDDFFRLFGTTAAREGGTLMSPADYARKFLPPEHRQLVADEIKMALDTADPNYTRQLEHGFRRVDGLVGVMSVRFGIVKDATGQTIKLYGASQDITEQKRAEDKQRELEGQLRQAQKLEALGTLAGGIAHDFNNILAAIISYTELAKLDNPDNPDLQDYLREVLQASGRASGLIKQILSFSRRQPQERQSLQLAPVIKEALKLLRSTLPATIEIQQEMDSDLPPVLADPGQIHQVVMNLCTNAGHAMRDQYGRLHVRLDLLYLPLTAPKPHAELREGTYVRLVISDTGHGMDAETLKRIFEPFFTTKATGEGTGLGLSVVHGIVKEHDGVIAVRSEPGQGAAFTIYLPALAPSATSPDNEAAQPPTGRGQRVMFVDDEPSLCNVAQRVIRRLGYQPLIFSSAAAAWSAIQNDPDACDVLVTDLTMPVMTGVDLARKVAGLRPKLPIILTSGYSGTLTREGLQEAGIRELVPKPLDYRALGLAIHRALTSG